MIAFIYGRRTLGLLLFGLAGGLLVYGAWGSRA
jgi:hypothetical protein